MNNIEKLYEMVNGIEYNRDIPKEAEQFAKENNLIVVVGGSDDLMYCYGAYSYMTDYCEHSYGWDGNTLENIGDKLLENEAKQIGLKIYWCGLIKDRYENVILKKENYNTEKSGAFSYSVKDGINFKEFLVYEDDTKDEVYCTGIIFELPKYFKRSIDEQICN